MNSTIRQYLAEIGRRGGIRGRRTLTAEQARGMVMRREGRRRLRAFERLAHEGGLAQAPGFDLVHAGMLDLANGTPSVNALLVSIAAPRLELLGIRLPPVLPLPEEQLFDALRVEYGDGAHARYNALVRRMVSFTRTVPLLRRAHARAD